MNDSRYFLNKMDFKFYLKCNDEEKFNYFIGILKIILEILTQLE